LTLPDRLLLTCLGQLGVRTDEFALIPRFQFGQQGNGVMLIVTADRHFDQFMGLRRVDPADLRFLREGG